MPNYTRRFRRNISCPAAEIELVWSLHGSVFYYAVRKHVFQVPVLEDQYAAIEQAVDLFLSGARRLVAVAGNGKHFVR